MKAKIKNPPVRAERRSEPQWLRITKRWRGLFSTPQRQSISVALAWTDEHRSKEARARAFDEYRSGGV